jgi:pilus assembly protein CpaF
MASKLRRRCSTRGAAQVHDEICARQGGRRPTETREKSGTSLSDIKLEMRKALPDKRTLRLSKMRQEQSLKAEISSIVQESLDELGVVFRPRRTSDAEQICASQSKASARFVLQDDSVSSILVNGPQQILERDGKYS